MLVEFRRYRGTRRMGLFGAPASFFRHEARHLLREVRKHPLFYTLTVAATILGLSLAMQLRIVSERFWESQFEQAESSARAKAEAEAIEKHNQQ